MLYYVRRRAALCPRCFLSGNAPLKQCRVEKRRHLRNHTYMVAKHTVYSAGPTSLSGKHFVVLLARLAQQCGNTFDGYMNHNQACISFRLIDATWLAKQAQTCNFQKKIENPEPVAFCRGNVRRMILHWILHTHCLPHLNRP